MEIEAERIPGKEEFVVKTTTKKDGKSESKDSTVNSSEFKKQIEGLYGVM